ncbi:ClpXP protease specificity-enhancing factor [Methylophilaceae bacterium]|nr:ClpXP protease specificity-enhancing factor [Methylophilaceae bacterium]|tara:strand:- start:368 stop:751 length:384 start_codon:yes stop_codon:yes gene_type:complete
MVSNKPYLVRGIFDWCVDSDLTPYLAAKILPGVRPPKSNINEKEIILNLSPAATTKLIINNDFISFSARFNGVNEEIYIPMSSVSGIYAHENGEGLFFKISKKEHENLKGKGSSNKKNKPSHLTLVK